MPDLGPPVASPSPGGEGGLYHRGCQSALINILAPEFWIPILSVFVPVSPCPFYPCCPPLHLGLSNPCLSVSIYIGFNKSLCLLGFACSMDGHCQRKCQSRGGR